MIYSLEIAEHVDKCFSKLDKNRLDAINKKISQILVNPEHFKPLKGDMKCSRRVYIDSFVLVFEFDKKNGVVRILDYQHHDYIYD